MRFYFFRIRERRKLYLCLLSLTVMVLASLSVAQSIKGMHALSVNSGSQPIFHGNPAKKEIALTCNVAWGGEWIDSFLKTLDREHVKMTFFIEGRWAEKNPDLVRKIVQAGHEIGNHSYSHPHPKHLTREKNQEQIRKTEKIFKDIAGIDTHIYAPPYGEWNEDIVNAASDLGYHTIMWSLDTIDWKREGTEVIINRVVSKDHNGAIVLMHPTEQTVKALPIIIKDLKKKGYNLVTISELLQRIGTQGTGP